MEHGPIYQIPDREAALEAVKQDGDALENASEDLQADRGVVLEAVKQNGRALEHASEDGSFPWHCGLVTPGRPGGGLGCAPLLGPLPG